MLTALLPSAGECRNVLGTSRSRSKNGEKLEDIALQVLILHHSLETLVNIGTVD